MDIQNFFFKQIPTYQEIHRLQTSGEKALSNIVRDFYSTRGLAKASMKAYASTPASMVVHMPVGAGYCKVNENIGNLGSVEKILRIGWNEPLAIDCSLDFNLASTIPSVGMKRYVSVFVRFKRSEENQRVNYLGETIYYDLKESYEIIVVSGIEAVSDPLSVNIEQENCILLFDVLLNENVINSGISNPFDIGHHSYNEIDVSRVEYLSSISISGAENNLVGIDADGFPKDLGVSVDAIGSKVELASEAQARILADLQHEERAATADASVHGIRKGHGNGFDADAVDGAHVSTDGSLSGNADTVLPTEKAVRTFVESAVSAIGIPMFSVKLAETLPQGSVVRIIEDNGEAKAKKVSGTANAGLFDNSAAVLAATVWLGGRISVTALSETAYVITSHRGTSGNFHSYARIAVVTGPEVTFGGEVLIDAANDLTVCALSPTRFMVGANMCCEVSGTTISIAVSETLPAPTGGNLRSAMIDASRIAIAYYDNISPYGVYGRIISTDGVDISFGAASALPVIHANVAVCALSENKIAICYIASVEPRNGFIVVGEIGAENAITFGTAVQFINNVFPMRVTIECEKLDENTVLIVCGGTSGQLFVASISGLDVSVGLGQPFASSPVNMASLAISSDGKAFIAYIEDNLEESPCKVIVARIEGGTATFLTTSPCGNGRPYPYSDDMGKTIGIEMLSINTFSVTWIDVGNTNVYTIIGQLLEDDRAYWIGVLQESGAAGETKHVALRGERYLRDTTLQIGKPYFIDGNGSLAIASTPYKAGIALSSSDLLLM